MIRYKAINFQIEVSYVLTSWMIIKKRQITFEPFMITWYIDVRKENQIDFQTFFVQLFFPKKSVWSKIHGMADASAIDSMNKEQSKWITETFDERNRKRLLYKHIKCW